MIDDVRLPDKFSRGSSGGFAFKTDAVRLVSGEIDREELWADPLGTWDVAHTIQSLEDMAALRAFHRARRGSARGFLFRDFLEYSSAANGIDAPDELDQPLGTGDGAETVFAIIKRYQDAGNTYDWPVHWPVEAAVLVAVNGVVTGGFTVQRGAGTITFAAPPAPGAVLTCGFEYDLPVHFVEDQLNVTFDTKTSRSAGQVPIEQLIGEDLA
ncbi:DUF2460 domain-containing protein [Allopontixanthobacter sp.]|uniref:DUF2460 domain-containing protein n=1 Tax=Allopontixanthobacter sp. TaxID=2906452 RepID=UPI002ABC66BD|nr:DUF2460 domain-containing protein [Allopontixanthobacter sp.]MDZ4306611.1 DUF2460 domain-containing protein [Allopontixanthobacter sp.]